MRNVFTSERLQARAPPLAAQANASAHNEMSRAAAAFQIALPVLRCGHSVVSQGAALSGYPAHSV